ncbi:hypothetical protein PDIDSM_4585 [Penicillium digitatum]|nr:hypothetical protein PDIDSM_4585 [Penicillium digitatum]
MADVSGKEAPSIKQFDYIGGFCAASGCGSVASCSPYTYILINVSLALLVGLFFVEGNVLRLLSPNRLLRTPGFTPLMITSFLGFGSFIGCHNVGCLRKGFLKEIPRLV